MPNTLADWAAAAQVASVFLTLILAAATFLAAWAALRTARTAERNFRAQRLPLVNAEWMILGSQDGQIHFAVHVSNATTVPIIMHGWQTHAQGVADGRGTGQRLMTGVETVIPVGGRAPSIALQMDARTEHPLDNRLTLVGTFSLQIRVSRMGIPDSEETWWFTGMLKRWAGESYEIDARAPQAIGQQQSFRHRCRQLWERWCQWNNAFRGGS